MSPTDKTSPRNPAKRSPARSVASARSTTNGRRRPQSRDIYEDVPVVDVPLVRPEPDRKLQNHVLAWVGLTNVTAWVGTSILAIATGSVPPLWVLAALPVLASPIPIIVRSVFPGRRAR